MQAVALSLCRAGSVRGAHLKTREMRCHDATLIASATLGRVKLGHGDLASGGFRADGKASLDEAAQLWTSQEPASTEYKTTVCCVGFWGLPFARRLSKGLPTVAISTLGILAKSFVFCRPPVKMNRTKKQKKTKKHAKNSEESSQSITFKRNPFARQHPSSVQLSWTNGNLRPKKAYPETYTNQSSFLPCGRTNCTEFPLFGVRSTTNKRKSTLEILGVIHLGATPKKSLLQPLPSNDQKQASQQTSCTYRPAK